MAGTGGAGAQGFGTGGGVTDSVALLGENVLTRLEEVIPTFWDLQNEVYPAIVEGMNEATLITGEPEIRASQVYTIPVSPNDPDTGQPHFYPLPLPSDGLALLRIEGTGSLSIHKCFVYDLDRHFPGWEVEVGDDPKFWFPFGLGQFGIYPCLTAPIQVVLNYVALPVTVPPPYTGQEDVPFQAEFQDGFTDYANHVLRLKEGGAEFDQSMAAYNRFLAQMEQLSNYAWRKSSLRFTRTAGSQSKISEIERS